jgi:hypothetical protein
MKYLVKYPFGYSRRELEGIIKTEYRNIYFGGGRWWDID